MVVIISRPFFILCLGLHESIKEEIEREADLRPNLDKIEFHRPSFGPKMAAGRSPPDVIVIALQPFETIKRFGDRVANFHAAYPQAGLVIVAPSGIDLDGVDAHVIVCESCLQSIPLAVAILLPTDEGAPPMHLHG